MEAAWQKVMVQNYNEGFSKGEARGFSIGRNEGISIGEARGISIGEARGIAIGCNETLNKLLSQGIITKEQAAQFQA